MKSSKIVFGILVIAISFAACQNVEFKKSSSGIPYKIFSSSKGDSVKTGYFVKYNVILKTKDTVLFNSYTTKNPLFVQIKPLVEKPAYSNIRATAEDLISKCKVGDSIYLVQSADSLLKQNPEMAAVYKKGQQVITTIKIEKVYKTQDEAQADAMKDQAAGYEENLKKSLAEFKKNTEAQQSLQKDSKIIEDYLTAHNINAEKNEWGVYIERITPGQGDKPKYGQFSNVKYKGSNLSGEVFDQNVMPVQTGMAQVVPGFAIGVSQLTKGEKAKVYIPSILAYGQQGYPPKIQPNQVLIFELEVLDITDKAPEPQTLPTPQTKDNKK